MTTSPQDEKPPVRVRYWIEIMRSSGTQEDVEEFSWDEWAAMTAVERESVGESLVEVAVENAVSGGWEVDGDEPPAAPESAQPEQQYRDLAATIAMQAQAIADNRVVGPRHGAVRRLAANVQTLAAWTSDDRSGVGSDPR